jgi:tight adherence protein B
MNIFSSTVIAVPLFALCVTVVLYFQLPRLWEKIYGRSIAQKDEVLKILDLMFVETTEKQVVRLMLLMSLGPGAIVFLVLWPNVFIGLPLGFLITSFMWSVPLRLLKSRFDKRANIFVDQMVDGLTIMSNGIKAGLSVTQAMERVVESLPNPISQEFNLVLSQIRLGRSIEEALVDLGERIPKADVQMFVTAINILKETGGNMAETFDTIVSVIRERQKIEKKIEAMTAQGLMQGMIVSMVPVGIITLLWIIDPAYIRPMFTTTLGIILLLIVFGLIIAGGVMVRKIVRIKV